MSATGFDVCVSGSGAVAMSLTLALSAEGWRVAWARQPESARPAQADVRTYALNARAIALLERLRVWPALKAWSSPVFEMKICGDAGGALSFSAWQQQVAELAWIVDAAALERLLGEAASRYRDAIVFASGHTATAADRHTIQPREVLRAVLGMEGLLKETFRTGQWLIKAC